MPENNNVGSEEDDFSLPTLPGDLSSVVIRNYEDWTQKAACRRQYVLFDNKYKIPRAKAICGVCEVALDCLIWSLLYAEEGVWGGRTEKERKNEFPESVRAELRDIARKRRVFYIRKGEHVILLRSLVDRAKQHRPLQEPPPEQSREFRLVSGL